MWVIWENVKYRVMHILQFVLFRQRPCFQKKKKKKKKKKEKVIMLIKSTVCDLVQIMGI